MLQGEINSLPELNWYIRLQETSLYYHGWYFVHISFIKYILHFKPDTIKSILNKVLKIYLYSKINWKVKKFWNINVFVFVFFSVLLMYQIPLSTAIWILILSLLYFIYNLQINFCCKKPNISPIFYLSSTFFCIQISRWQKLPSQFHEINKHTQKFFLKTRYIYLSFTFDNCVFDPDVLVEYGHVDFHDWQSLCRNMFTCIMQGPLKNWAKPRPITIHGIHLDNVPINSKLIFFYYT